MASTFVVDKLVSITSDLAKDKITVLAAGGKKELIFLCRAPHTSWFLHNTDIVIQASCDCWLVIDQQNLIVREVNPSNVCSLNISKVQESGVTKILIRHQEQAETREAFTATNGEQPKEANSACIDPSKTDAASNLPEDCFYDACEHFWGTPIVHQVLDMVKASNGSLNTTMPLTSRRA